MEKNKSSVSCECGEVTGELCVWTGAEEDTVIVEYMPVYLRESHKAAGNSGVYPHNGAVQFRASRACAQELIANDPDWTSIEDE